MGARWQRVATALATRDYTERTATLAAALAVGQSFAPSLLPRSKTQQAFVTGLSAALIYSVARTSQSAIGSIAARIRPGHDGQSFTDRRKLAATANSVAIAAGLVGQRVVPARRGEPTKRAVLRTAMWTVTATGALGLSITVLNAGVNSLTDRTGRIPPSVVPAGFLAGATIAAGEIAWYRRKAPGQTPVARSLIEGLGVMTVVSAVAVAERKGARIVSRWVRRNAPGFAGLAEPLGHLTTLAPVALVIWSGLEWVYRRTEHGGAAVEDAYSTPPTSRTASGGPASGVGWDTLGREGRRFVNMTMPAKEITAVTGLRAADPVRVFIGLDSAATVDARVSKAMDELEALGAFDRSVLCLASPTGTGYVNYVVAETLEYLTEGDCAIVAMQYSLRPSFLSLDRVQLGREQNRVLLHAINGRLRATPAHARPRLVALGESLGAFTLQDAFLHEGTAGLHRAGIERALFIGTPAESGWADQWRLDRENADPESEVVEVASYREWESLPEEVRKSARYFLLSHHDDPITKYSPVLAVQAPDWMANGPQRSPAMPAGVPWRPVSTFFLTTVDVLNASKVTPGEFAARGHDYRADLAQFTRLAFDLPGSPELMLKVELALRRRERSWAERRVVAEQLAQARESISRQLKSWSATD
ncbi:MAG: alpha/beta-hydrolase family protein [Actinobacteria bacterium]|nr:alpha/beta-hydrolase family protein [Actinomycetota bacterium]